MELSVFLQEVLIAPEWNLMDKCRDAASSNSAVKLLAIARDFFVYHEGASCGH